MPTRLASFITATPVLPAGNNIDGTDADDTLYGSDFDDTMHGLGRNDWLFGGAGNDQMFGDDGSDYLYGGTGRDALYGGSGDDSLGGGPGADRLDGGDGIDTASYAGSAAVTIDLSIGSGYGGDSEGDTYISIENLAGSDFIDVLIGDAGVNTLWGGAGDDQLVGNLGSDRLFGGTGNDVLVGGGFPAGGSTYALDGDDVLDGGAGNDILYGDNQSQTPAYLHTGQDRFVIAKGQGADTIMDFQPGLDKIVMNGFLVDNHGGHHYALLGNDGILATSHWESGYYVFPQFGVSELIFENLDGDRLFQMGNDLYEIDSFDDGLLTLAGRVATVHSAQFNYHFTASDIVIGDGNFYF
jgi:Ca2+-binding RTX toxin-like protein